MSAEIDVAADEGHALSAQALALRREAWGETPGGVHHAVGWDARVVAAVHRVADGARRTGAPRQQGDEAVGGDATRRNPADDVVDPQVPVARSAYRTACRRAAIDGASSSCGGAFSVALITTPAAIARSAPTIAERSRIPSAGRPGVEASGDQVNAAM